MKKKAFTLAETLITLAIIGIIAAMTIPRFIVKYEEKKNIIELKKTYVMLQNAFKEAEREEGRIDTWEINSRDSTAGALKLGNYFFPHLDTEKVCGRQSGCWNGGTYKALNGKDDFLWQPGTWPVFSSARLKNGQIIYVWSGGTGCPLKFGPAPLDKACGYLAIDINGDRPPNQAGRDFFSFAFTTKGIFPTGVKGATNIPFSGSCNFSLTARYNGITCTAWAIMKENMDYLRKNIVWD